MRNAAQCHLQKQIGKISHKNFFVILFIFNKYHAFRNYWICVGWKDLIKSAFEARKISDSLAFTSPLPPPPIGRNDFNFSSKINLALLFSWTRYRNIKIKIIFGPRGCFFDPPQTPPQGEHLLLILLCDI